MRATAERFGEYARVVAAALGDRVPLFITLNEPWCSAYLGYASGVHAPGRTDPALALAAVHHLNLAHGLAAAAIRGGGAGGPGRGDAEPGVGAPGDRLGRSTSTPPAAATGCRTGCSSTRSCTAATPPTSLADTAGVTGWGFVRPGDMEVIAAPLDVLGLNYYSPLHVRHWTREHPRETADGHGDSAATPWIACDDVEFPQPSRSADRDGLGHRPARADRAAAADAPGSARTSIS